MRQRLAEQTADRTMRGRVKAVLLDSLAAGACNSEDVARKLNTSKRSLQRRLEEEGVSFKDVLTETRIELADHYLRQPGMSIAEITFLLGFRDPTSFFRAFQAWTGKTPTAARREFIGPS